ncbi:MAG TPA: O-antigen ligase family protein [Candidatus Dormibacteraeota bacterium]|nr:O-antigen ligase family protein [Candidatus Dormibacteraeota bacterium]
MIRRYLPVLALLAPIIPWGSGGREGWAVVVSVFAMLLGAFFILQRHYFRPAGKYLLAATAGLTAWAAASYFWSVNNYQTGLWVMYLLMAIIGFSLARQLTDWEARKWILGYLATSTAFSLYGIYLYLAEGYERFTSLFYWANPAATFLIPAFLIAFWYFLGSHKLRYGALSTIFLTSLLLTYSRGGLAVLALLSLIALTFSRTVRKGWVKIVFVLGISILLSTGATYIRQQIGVQHVDAGSRFAETVKGESTSLSDRANYLASAVAIWSDNPFLGTGAGTYETIHPQYQKRVISASSHAHNAYLQTLAELGILGFLLLLAVKVALILGVLKTVWLKPELRIVALSLVGLLIHFGLDTGSRYPALILLLAILAGLTYASPRPVRKNSRILPISLILALVLAVSFQQSQTWAIKAETAAEERDYIRTAELYRQAHTGLLYDPDYWTQEGIYYYTLASFTGKSKTFTTLARDRAEQAVRLDPKDAQHYFLLARTEKLAGSIEKAESLYRKTLELDPYNHPQYYFDLAKLQAARGKIPEAIQTADTVLRLYDEAVLANRVHDKEVPRTISGVMVFKADHLARAGHIKEARSLAEKAIKVYPANAAAGQLIKALPE